MTMSLKTKYFKWLCHFVYDERNMVKVTYTKIFKHLYNVYFFYTLDRDENRAQDGIDLRYRFGRENGYQDIEIQEELDVDACTVLEMMVALAIRCEDTIMSDPSYGDRTGLWFWNMLVSLGLSGMNDKVYDPAIIDNVLTIFLNRMYQPDGRGGLFTIHNCPQDLTEVEIWYQMNWYLNDYISEFDV